MASKNKALMLAICAFSLCLAFSYSQAGESKSQQEQPQTSSQPQHPTRVRVSQGVMAAFIVKKVPPEYPTEARKKHIQGTVVLHGVISKEGDVAEVSAISGDAMLTAAAIDAVKQWKYKPYLLNGQPVEVETQFQLNFSLSGN